MDFLADFYEYIFGSFVFFVICFGGMRLFNKYIVDKASEALADFITEIGKKSSKPDEKHARILEKEREIEQEIDIYENQQDLEVIGGEKPEKNKKKNKIIGINTQSIKGKFTNLMFKKQLEILRNLDLKIVEEKGIKQAQIIAQRQREGMDGGVSRRR